MTDREQFVKDNAMALLQERDDLIERQAKELDRLNRTRESHVREIKRLQGEIERLKRGDFTEEEFQGLCHNFSEDDRCRFENGCYWYQKRLFGFCGTTLDTVKLRSEYIVHMCRGEQEMRGEAKEILRILEPIMELKPCTPAVSGIQST